MKICLIADLHIHPYTRFSSIGKSGLNSWVETSLSVLGQVYQKCKERDIKEVWILGDLFHVGFRLYTDVFNAVYRFFAARKEEGFYTRLIVGNHDLVNRRDVHNSALVGLEGVVTQVVHGQPQVPYYRAELTLGGVQILFVPYTEDYLSLKKYVDDFVRSYPEGLKIVAGHLALDGAVVGRDEYQPREGCSLELFNKMDFIALGHYHKRQCLSSKVWYIGSMMPLDFHDADDEKGMTILTIEDKIKYEFVPLDTPGFSVIDPGSVDEVCVTDKIVRIDYDDDSLQEETVRAKLLEKGARAVVFNCTSVKKIEERVVDPTVNLATSIQAYIDSSATSLNKARLKQLADEIVLSVEGVKG